MDGCEMGSHCRREAPSVRGLPAQRATASRREGSIARHMVNRRTWLCFIGLLILAGCDREAGPSEGFFSQESPSNLRLDDRQVVCDTCILARRLLTLGDTAGPGSLFAPWWYLVKDNVGNYWVSQRGAVKVFTDEGEFIHEVGRLGQGPLEFAGNPMPFYADPMGRVHVHDLENARVSIIDRDYRLATDVRLPGGPFALVGLAGMNRYLANMWVPSVEQIGLPLHVVEGGSIVTSFGLTQHDAAAESPLVARRVIAVDDHERIVAARPYEYVIDFWSPTGTHLGKVEGPQLNEQLNRSGQPYQLQNEIYAVRLDHEGRLWVLTWRVAPDWRDSMKEVVYPNGQMRLEMKDSTASTHELYTSRVDVIDLDTGLLIARHEDKHAKFHSFIGDNEVMAVELAAYGDVRLGIWTLSLTSTR